MRGFFSMRSYVSKLSRSFSCKLSYKSAIGSTCLLGAMVINSTQNYKNPFTNKTSNNFVSNNFGSNNSSNNNSSNNNSSNNTNSNNNKIKKEQRDIVDNERIERRWSQLRLFSGTANPELSKEVAKHLRTRLNDIKLNKYADGEISVRILENVRGKDCFIIQPTCPPGVNDNLMELLLMISTMRRSSARSITAVLPYYGYARQDRKMQSRVPISAADVARLLESMGVDRVVAVDLHCGQIQGFFSTRTPCDNLDGSIVALDYFFNIAKIDLSKCVVVSPDAGGVYRAKRFRDGLIKMGAADVGLAMIVKQRQGAGIVKQMDLVGNVQNMDCIIVDDMIDTAGTLCKAGKELKLRGANKIYAFATHGLFNGPAIDRINNSEFEKVVVCNTVPLGNKYSSKIDQLSVGNLIAKAIYCIHFKTSISGIFEFEKSGKLRSHPIDSTSGGH